MPDYFDTGFCVRKPSWHQKESLLDEYPESWDAARMAAGLMWEPTYRDLYIPSFLPAAAEGPEGALFAGAAAGDLAAESNRWMVPVEGFRAIVRDDTGAVLATPKDSFELIYHGQMGELLDSYTEAWRKAGAKVLFETAGSVRGGAMVWALVRLDEPYTIPGDETLTYPYAVLLNAHDGSAACRLGPVQVRVVCWNTWKAAEFELAGSKAGVVLRHTGNVSEKVEQAKATLATMRDDAKAWQVVATDLASINVDDAFVRTFAERFIPTPENATDRVRSERDERRNLLMAVYNESPTTDGVRGTAYGLVQAASEYLDHLRPFRSKDTYLARTLFSAEPVKAGVLKLVREMANA